MVKSVSAVGVHGGLHAKRDNAVFMECVEACIKLLAEGKIQPHVSAEFPLSQVGRDDFP